jgi:glutaredoxin
MRLSVPLALFTQQQTRSLESNAASATSKLPDITLYQYKICPYCSRPKTLLDYLKVPYKTVEVNPLTKSQISFSKDYKKVPIALIDEAVVNDSKAIVKSLQERLSADPDAGKRIKCMLTDDRYLIHSKQLQPKIFV